MNVGIDHGGTESTCLIYANNRECDFFAIRLSPLGLKDLENMNIIGVDLV